MDTLLRKHAQAIFNVCMRMAQDEDDAHDIAQETCIKIMKGLEKFERKAAFSTWAHRIAYHESLRFLQKRREHVDLDEVAPYLGTPDDYGIDARDAERLVRASLDSLGKIDRMIVLFFYYDELKIREISEIMNMNESTVKTRLSRAKSFLRIQLEPL